MKKIQYSNQSGRSMVEMLGVLAIIGVLSVGGIAGYSKAMAKYKLGKVTDQITTTVTNIRTLYSGQRTYDGLDNSVANSMNLVSSDMKGSGSEITNGFGGAVTIAAVNSLAGTTDGSFTVRFAGLSKDACISLASSDWGGSGSGLEQITASATATAGSKQGVDTLPFSLSEATTACACTTDICSIEWQYY